MTSKSGKFRTEPRGPVASRERPSRAWQVLVGVGVVVLGLWLTVSLAVRLIHRAEGYAPGDADCDDCGLTLVLDNLGWLAAAVGGYLGLLFLAWWVLRRRTRRSSSTGS